ncbi:hypothetical protein ABT127_29505 [Streptomyces sp. NPDC001904]|uniref:hypothetical protein n=1 Tax=Streptomyces sp. NPDC001904 TaxID=3154531 RepID=UPI0033271506
MAAARARNKTHGKKTAAPRRPSRPAAPKAADAASTAGMAATDADTLVFARVADARDRAADIIDAARDRAADVQAEAETAAAHTVKATHERIAQLLGDAETQATGTIADATRAARDERERAAANVGTARGEAEQLLTEARQRAETIITEARAQVAELTEHTAADREATATAVAELRRLAGDDLAELSALVEQRRGEAGQILARAQEQAEQLVAAARHQVEQAHKRCEALTATAAVQYDGRRAEAEALYADAVKAADARRREADEQVTAAHRDAEQARTELRDTLRTLTEQFDTEAAARRRKLTDELAGLQSACEQQRERLRTEAGSVAARLREAAQKEADRIIADAEKKAKGVTDRAEADEFRAKRMLKDAQDAKRANSRWSGLSQKLGHKAWKTAPWIALTAGVGLAASGEYELARMVGINQYVAPLLPVSIDVYCVTAFRAKKDIPYALLLMASANVTYHLSEQAEIVKPGHSAPWQLTTFVVLIFVAVIWRVHTLMHTSGTHDADSTERNGTADRTGTPDRTGTVQGQSGERTQPVHTDLYGADSAVHTGRSAAVADSTNPVRTPGQRQGADTTNGGLSSANSHRTDGVHTTADTRARTGSTARERTGSASAAVQARTATVSVRTPPGQGGVHSARTGTDAAPSGASGTGADRTGTPYRTDDELAPLVQNLPRDANGFVSLYRARTDLGVNQDRAVRLLSAAGLLRPQDADKHLT